VGVVLLFTGGHTCIDIPHEPRMGGLGWADQGRKEDRIMVAVGSVLQDRYEMDEMLGRGGFGSVYRAHDTRLKKLVAIKETLHVKPEVLRLFEREAELLASLDHPALPAVTDYFNEGKNYYIVMTYVPGIDLSEHLDAQPGKRLSEHAALELLLPVLDALEYMHTREPPIIHRDIKPSNIRITPDNKVYLVDFGLAKSYETDNLNPSSVLAITPKYSPPEQYFNNTDTRSDLYALGATLYTMLCGASPIAAHERMSNAELIPMADRGAEVSPQTEDLVLRLLAMSADDRYQMVGELRREMRAILADLVPPPLEQETVAGTERIEGLLPPAPTTASNRDTETASTTAHKQETMSVQRASPLAHWRQRLRDPRALGGVAALVVLLLVVIIWGSGALAGTSAPAASNATGLDRVREAVVKIRAEGAFAYPRGQRVSWIGQGSGFIIDSAGLAVTSNHVVAGAGTLEVFLEGDERPRTARVLGTSECLDLAVIDIAGEGFAALDMYEGEVAPAMEVVAAGFPLDQELTLTRGTITKAAANGETAWAAIEDVIEHDAAISPGSSGGPLLTPDGEVIGINYRTRTEDGQQHAYAIGGDAALPVLQDLRDGERVLAIGVNGEALNRDGISGIWVYSVESGSPADLARVRPGDIITSMEGIDLAQEGTLAKYCRVLQSHSPDDVLTMRVLRYASGERFEGQLNGRELEPLAQPTLLAQQPSVTSAPTTPPTAVPTAAPTTPPTAAPAAPTAPPTAALTSTPTPERDIPTAARISDLNDLSDTDIQTSRQSYQASLNLRQNRLSETFDRPATKRLWREYNDTAAFTQRLVNSYYEITLREPAYAFTDYWDAQQLGDSYLVQLDAAFGAEAGLSKVGILFDMQDSTTMSQFLIRSDNAWELRTIRNGVLVPERSGVFSTETIQGAGGVNQLRVVRTPEQVEFWINDTPVGTVVAGPQRGYVGIAAMSGEVVPVSVIVDNLYVWQ
jgi:S1-C subfamily serine protease